MIEEWIKLEEDKIINKVKKVIVLSGREYGPDTEFHKQEVIEIKARAYDRIILLMKSVGTEEHFKARVELEKLLKTIDVMDVIGSTI